MKKVSTVAAKASKKISQQKLTVGLDLGDRNSWYCVLDEAGKVLLEQRLSTSGKALREGFGGMPHSRIALVTNVPPAITLVNSGRKRRLVALPGIEPGFED